MYYVYITASKKNGTLYVGVTNDLSRRTYQHKSGDTEGFTKKYRVDQLVYFEEYTHIKEALQREKQIKKWNRTWKIRMIEKENPTWRDFYDDIT